MSKTASGDTKQVTLDSDEAAADGFTVMVDAEDIITALREQHVYDRDEMGVDVMTVRPPFTGECEASHRFSKHDERWPKAMMPKPIDIAPSMFVANDCTATFPTWEGVREAMRDEGIERTDEAEWELYEDRKAEWAVETRAALVDEITISRAGRSLTLPVEYED